MFRNVGIFGVAYNYVLFVTANITPPFTSTRKSHPTNADNLSAMYRDIMG